MLIFVGTQQAEAGRLLRTKTQIEHHQLAGSALAQEIVELLRADRHPESDRRHVLEPERVALPAQAVGERALHEDERLALRSFAEAIAVAPVPFFLSSDMVGL